MIMNDIHLKLPLLILIKCKSSINLFRWR